MGRLLLRGGVGRGLAATLTIYLFGCGGAQQGNMDGGMDGSMQMCTSTAQCTNGQVCSPTTNVCTTTVACTQHSDCGSAAYCDTTSGNMCKPSTTASPCAADSNCSRNQRCVSGHCGCNGEVYQAQNVSPNMLIVLDRSGSMNERVVSGNPQTKWQAAKAALSNLVGTYGGRVRFGLKFYPGTNLACTTPTSGTCNGGYVAVEVPAASNSDVTNALSGASTCSMGTPTAEALDPLDTYMPLEDTARSNYVLLVTDGQSTCTDPTPKVTDLHNQTPQVRTYVIGFGGGVDAGELNALAMAGGTARSMMPYYYQADSTSALESAFQSIVSGVVSCDYSLSTTPPVISQLYVYFGNTQVPRDTNHVMGWDYSAMGNKVTFYGATCDQLKSGQVTNLSIIYGCPAIVQ